MKAWGFTIRTPPTTDNLLIRLFAAALFGYAIAGIAYFFAIYHLFKLPNERAIELLVQMVQLGGEPAWFVVTSGLCLLGTTLYLKLDSWAEEVNANGFDNLDRISLWALLMLSIIAFTTRMGLAQGMSAYEAHNHQYSQILIYLSTIFLVPGARHAANLFHLELESLDVERKGMHVSAFLLIYAGAIVASTFAVYLGVVNLPERIWIIIFVGGFAVYLTTVPIFIEKSCDADDLPKHLLDKFVKEVNQFTASWVYQAGRNEYILPVAAILFGIGIFVFSFSFNALHPPDGMNVVDVITHYVSPFSAIFGVLQIILAAVLLISPPFAKRVLEKILSRI